MGDSDSLLLLVMPHGSKLWRFKFRIARSEKVLSIGVYPDVGLADARKRWDEARRLVADGKDPALEKRWAKIRALPEARNIFELLCGEFCRKRRNDEVGGWAPAP